MFSRDYLKIPCEWRLAHLYKKPTMNSMKLPWIPGERVPEKSVFCEDVDAYSEEEEKRRGNLEKYESL